MKKVARWAGYGLGGLLGLVLLAAAGIWGMSAYALGRTVEARPERVDLAHANLAEGRRMLAINGCQGCHGPDLRGTKFFDQPGVGTLNAPNLTLLAASVTDQQLAQAIRQGIGHDGRPLMAMPSSTYAALTDAELSNLIAAIRAEPRGGTAMPAIALGPLGHLGVALGKFRSEPELLADPHAETPVDLGPATAPGRHLALTACAHCHGANLTGNEIEPGVAPPDLAVVGSYDRAQFAHLMKTGLPPGGRHLKLMTEAGEKGFSHLTDAEVSALFDYLQARARQEQARGSAVRGS